jgi:hypothetical protein
MLNYYNRQINQLNVLLATHIKKDKLFLTLKLVLFFTSFILFYLYFFQIKTLGILLAAIITFILYLLIYIIDLRNSKQIAFIRCRIKNYQREKDYLQHDFSQLDCGEDFKNASHPFSLDLDIFGFHSLFQHICRTVTTDGRKILASKLQTFSNNLTEITAYREAVKELSAMDEWRNKFFSISEPIDTNHLLKVVQGIQFQKSGFSNPLVLLPVICSVSLFFISIVLSIFSIVSSEWPLIIFIMQIVCTLPITSRKFSRLDHQFAALHKALNDYAALIDYLQHASFRTQQNKQNYDTLFSSDINAQNAFRQLSAISGAIDRRNSFAGLLFFNGFVCNDFFLIRKIERWFSSYLTYLPEWVTTIGEIDAKVSLATFRFNHPGTTDAILLDNDSITYRTKGLYHPFISKDKAVPNDFEIRNNHIYIITGANMAGKSTFLRSLGINYVLAMCGLPVFASSLEMSVFSLFSSMRTDDDLPNGISYFNAELLRLQQLITHCNQQSHTLIILDEILKGTNSADKLNGSKLFLRTISKMPISAVIATHDLALSQLENENSNLYSNYCFEIELSTSITYSYKIQRGVAKNMNATFLLQNLLSRITIPSNDSSKQ